MWIFGGTTAGERDLGYVAEQCPHCGLVGSCRVTAQYEGLHLYFVELAGSYTKCVCTCGGCGSLFPGDLWRYGDPLTAHEASQLDIDRLIERTNPSLRERLERADVQAQYETDPTYQAAQRSIDRLRTGEIRKKLSEELLRWGDLDDAQRESLRHRSGELANTTEFMESISKPFSIRGGCLVAVVVSVAIWLTFVWLPAARSLGWGIIVGAAGLFVGMLSLQAVAARQAKLWTIHTCVPKGRDAGIDFQLFLSLLEDLPPSSSYSTDLLRHLKEQEAAIHEGLITARVIEAKPAWFGK